MVTGSGCMDGGVSNICVPWPTRVCLRECTEQGTNTKKVNVSRDERDGSKRFSKIVKVTGTQ